MDLPSFLWLWRIAAWAMGLAIAAYICLAIAGWQLRHLRHQRLYRRRLLLRRAHFALGVILVGLVVVLAVIGLVGTLGHYGSLGHSWHLPAGLLVVALVFASASVGHQISSQQPWMRVLHIAFNISLGIALTVAGISGWIVVQKYLP